MELERVWGEAGSNEMRQIFSCLCHFCSHLTLPATSPLPSSPWHLSAFCQMSCWTRLNVKFIKCSFLTWTSSSFTLRHVTLPKTLQQFCFPREFCNFEFSKLKFIVLHPPKETKNSEILLIEIYWKMQSRNYFKMNFNEINRKSEMQMCFWFSSPHFSSFWCHNKNECET